MIFDLIKGLFGIFIIILPFLAVYLPTRKMGASK